MLIHAKMPSRSERNEDEIGEKKPNGRLTNSKKKGMLKWSPTVFGATNGQVWSISITLFGHVSHEFLILQVNGFDFDVNDHFIVSNFARVIANSISGHVW